jgi:hypothetical protein
MTPPAPPAVPAEAEPKRYPAVDLSVDPMPVPPQQPELEACCGDGCNPCIFDLYDLAMDDYRQAWHAWRARHPDLPAAQG